MLDKLVREAEEVGCEVKTTAHRRSSRRWKRSSRVWFRGRSATAVPVGGFIASVGLQVSMKPGFGRRPTTDFTGCVHRPQACGRRRLAAPIPADHRRLPSTDARSPEPGPRLARAAVNSDDAGRVRRPSPIYRVATCHVVRVIAQLAGQAEGFAGGHGTVTVNPPKPIRL